MKHILPIAGWLLMVLMAVATGCDRAPRYDQRLVQADSLMQPDPDSALAIVEAVNRDSLADEGDRAYRDLLLTQARYRCYIVATSDSDINRALSFYRRHSGEREKLTRAYIYKGAVMDELGHPDSAMYYYKYAEATAAPDDYFNLGYVKMRIADLYLTQISQDSLAIIRLHDSKHYFELRQDTSFIIKVLGKLGAICGDLYPDSAIKYLNQSIELAQQFNPSLQYSPKSTLAGVLLFQGEYDLSKELSLDIIHNGASDCDEQLFYYYAALSFVRLGQIDSAKRILAITPPPADEVDSLAYYNATAEIHKAEGNPQLYSRDLAQTKKIAIDVLSTSKAGKLIAEETDFALRQADQQSTILSRRNTSLIFLVILAVAIIFATVIFAIRLKIKNKAIEEEKALIQEELEHTLSKLGEQQNEARNETVSELVGKRLSALQDLYRDIRVKWADDNKVKQVVPLSSMIRSLSERKLLMKVELRNSFWEKMRLSVDGELKGIVTYVEKHYPNLTDDDIKVFCLLCAGISPQIIRICMNFENAKTVTNYKSRIIKKKMGLDMTFDEFVDWYLNHEHSNQ